VREVRGVIYLGLNSLGDVRWRNARISSGPMNEGRVGIMLAKKSTRRLKNLWNLGRRTHMDMGVYKLNTTRVLVYFDQKKKK
jgi:hypothetical protein